MSKILSTTSYKHDTQEPPPMTFSDLDIITSSLWQELDEFELDFERKVDFIREQEPRILGNEKKLLVINDLVNVLKASTLKIEWELEEYECGILGAEKILCHLQHYGESMSSDSNNLLELFASNEILIAETNRLKEEFAAFNEEAESQRPSLKNVFSILAYVQYLEQTENQLRGMQDKVDETTRIFNEIKKEMCSCDKRF